jgi:hypothetical protein
LLFPALQYAMLWQVVVAAMGMTTITVFFFIRLLFLKSIPKVGTSFLIFSEHEDIELSLDTVFICGVFPVDSWSSTLCSILSHPNGYRFRTSCTFYSDLPWTSEHKQPSLNLSVGCNADPETECIWNLVIHLQRHYKTSGY